MAEARWACPHCGADLGEVVMSLIANPRMDGATAYRRCGSCDKDHSIAISLDVYIGDRSFREEHPDLAAQIADREALNAALPASRS